MDQWWLIVPVALLASTLSAIAGTGAGIVLLPLLVSIYGIRDAVPTYAIAQLIGSLSRIGINRTQISLPVVGWFSLGTVPLAILGSWAFTKVSDAGILRILGMFLILAVVVRRAHPRFTEGFRVGWFAPVGAVFSVISGVVGSAGPFLAPFYLAYGLTRGAFIGTEALGTAIMHVVKLSSYQLLGAMTVHIWIAGITIGPLMFVGAFIGKRILEKISPATFLVIVDVIIVIFGSWFLTR